MDRYSGAWDGRDGTPQYDYVNQTDAIYVLLAGLEVADTTSAAPKSGTGTDPQLGAIIGGAVGSVVLVLLAFGLVLFRYRHKLRKPAFNVSPMSQNEPAVGHADHHEQRSDQSEPGSRDTIGSRRELGSEPEGGVAVSAESTSNSPLRDRPGSFDEDVRQLDFSAITFSGVPRFIERGGSIGGSDFGSEAPPAYQSEAG